MKKTKRTSLLLVTFVFVFLFAFASFAGTWEIDAGGWWWNDGGYEKRPKNCWVWCDGNHDGIAECYYFNGNGNCLLNTITPDNYQVDANGAWITGEGVMTKAVGTAGPSVTANGNPDGAAAKEKLLSLKSVYPEGTPWGNEKCYCRSYGNTDYEWYGCAAFALMCQCHLYGTGFNYRTHTNLSSLHPGDVITMNVPGGQHMVVVLSDNGDSVTVCEGNYNNAVHWERVIKKSDIPLVDIETVF